ncbi:MAG: hypothetical protein ACRC80_05070, partial [Waterburya sp.]
MLTFELTPNIKARTYRVLENGVELIRNLSKKAAVIIVNKINQAQKQEIIKNDFSEDFCSDSEYSQIRLSKESNYSGSARDNSSTLVNPRNQSTTISQSGRSEVGVKPSGDGAISNFNQSSGKQDKISNSDYLGILKGDFTATSELARNIVDESR